MPHTTVGAAHPDGYRQLDIAEALAWHKTFVVLDVRGHDGHDHIPRSKVIQMADLEKEAARLDKTAPVMLVSEHGRRSAEAAVKLRKLGFEWVYSLTGGIERWRARGMPLESDDEEIFDLGGEDDGEDDDE